MLTELKMMPAIGRSGNNGVDGGLNNGDDMENDLGIILRQQDGDDRERDLNIFRSGSAPPSVEGSLSAVGGLFFDDSPSFNGLSEFRNCNGNGNGNLSEDDLRSDPAYHAYYYSNANLNPRLPPPGLSKEDWRFAQRLQGGNSVLGGIGDKRRGNNRMPEDGSNSQYAYQCVPNNSRHNLAGSSEWLNREADGLIGLSGLAIGSRPKDESGRPFTGHSRPSSRNTFEDNLEALANLDISSGNGNRVSSVPPIGPSATQTFASVLGGGSLSRSTTPDPQLVARVPSPGLPPVGVRINSMDIMGNNGSNGTFNNFSASNQDSSSDISTVFSGMNHMPRTSLTDEDYLQSHSRIKKELEDQSYYLERHGRQKHQSLMKNDQDNLGGIAGHNGNLNLLSQGQYNRQRNIVSSSNSYLKAPSGSSGGSPRVSSSQFNNYDGLNASSYGGYGHNVYPGSPVHPSMLANHMAATNLPPLFQNAAAASMASLNLDSRTLGGSSAAELQNLSRIANQAAAAGIQMPLVDPVFDQYMRTPEYASQFSSNPNDPSIDRSYLIGLQKAYIDALLSAQNNPNLSYLSKSGNFNPGYYNDPSFGLGMSYPGSPLSNSVHNASVGPGSPMRHSDHGMRVPSVMRNLNGGLIGSWTSEAGIHNMDESFASSLLEEFKSNKTKCFELSEIAGHVVEFSADQYGSRFIQQKLEAATIEEKNMVFEEIFPEILSLMTDVFGNYVIQKFFEHGTGSQRKQLADGLKGHVLALSLQMYGCRVIQKAIEVVNLDEQTNMVAELDGHIMRCVRDQNGNHVIQKCIECIPQESIVFIISSFYDKVVTLSTHPYGCRVIQRVLEHCDDPKTQKIVMDEIMQSVCMLAQDQYGNYVVQHVLGNGKPHERSAIITQLAGQIVQMSQQKFASNVVEKCLAYGGPAERQILVNEMLGTTDENEPLQAMMKDQFANYVVQKVLETCDDQQREHILSRIKVHLNALKKYTYGKHIVARVEKLVAAGERRGGLQSSYSSST